MLNAKGLCGAMVFFDGKKEVVFGGGRVADESLFISGQTNDSRMNIALALTGVALGVTGALIVFHPTVLFCLAFCVSFSLFIFPRQL
jgi:hypothetical protein